MGGKGKTLNVPVDQSRYGQLSDVFFLPLLYTVYLETGESVDVRLMMLCS